MDYTAVSLYVFFTCVIAARLLVAQARKNQRRRVRARRTEPAERQH